MLLGLKTRKVRSKPKKVKGEAAEQRKFFTWLSYKNPYLRRICFAIPNGGSRHFLEAINLKNQGVTPGVPDVFIALPNNRYHGLFIEFKFGRNKTSRKQVEMITLLKQRGYQVSVCYSSEEAQKALEEYTEELEDIRDESKDED